MAKLSNVYMIQERHSLLLYSMHMLNFKKIITTNSVYFIVPSGKKKTSIEVQFDDRVL